MSVAKRAFYDWGGFNAEIFYLINSIHAFYYDITMLVVSTLSSRLMVMTYLIVIGCYAIAMAIMRKTMGLQGSAVAYLKEWLSVALVLVIAFFIHILILHWIKTGMPMPRPFMHLSSVRMTGDRMSLEDYWASFPSGHAIFATILAGALWPVLWASGKTLAVLFVFAVCWARVALGMQYPVDVVSGVLIGLAIVLPVRKMIDQLFGYY